MTTITIDARIHRGTSCSRLPLVTGMGYTSATAPMMASVLKMLLPKTLPIAMAELVPLAAATVLTTSSGAEVPKATTVSPMTSDEMLNLCAIDEAPSVSQSAPLMTISSPMANFNINKNSSISMMVEINWLSQNNWNSTTKLSILSTFTKF